MKYVKELTEIKGEGEYCAIFSHPEEEYTQIDLCNSIGTTIETKQVALEVSVYGMSKTHIIACS
jgi:WD repeat-containing protein 35